MDSTQSPSCMLDHSYTVGGEQKNIIEGSEHMITDHKTIDFDLAGGSTAVQLQDGSTAIQLEDGSTAIQLEDGSTAIQLQDGSTSIQLEDGSTAIQLQDGSTSIQLEDGSTAIQLEDGSFLLPQPPGAQDGSSVQAESCSIIEGEHDNSGAIEDCCVPQNQSNVDLQTEQDDDDNVMPITDIYVMMGEVYNQSGKNTMATGGASGKCRRRKGFTCNICGENFTVLSCLKTHVAAIHSNVTHLCETCGKCYKRQDHLKLHLKTHSGVKQFTCVVCNKAFIDNNSLKIHTRTHTGEKPFRCEECGKTFSQQAHMKSHVRIHTGEKPFKCSICEKAFRQLSTKIEHERTHKKRKRIRNRTIEAENDNSVVLENYSASLQNESNVGDTVIPNTDICVRNGEVCDQPSENLLASGDKSGKYRCRKQSICNICRDSFSAVSYLKTHMTTNHCDVPHVCKTCGKGYKKKHHLKFHMKFHSGANARTCEVCKKEFTDNNSLKLHMRTHTGEKPYRCEECGKSFSQQSHMKSHARLHTGERPYQCPNCKKSFRHLSARIKHEKMPKKCKSVTVVENGNRVALENCYVPQNQSNDELITEQEEDVVMPITDKYGSMGDQRVFTENGQQYALSEASVRPDEIQLVDVKSEVDGASSNEAEEADYDPFEAMNMKSEEGMYWSTCNSTDCNNVLKSYKQFLCETCGQNFLHANSLRAHKANQHTGECTLKCNFCDIEFSLLSQVRGHIRMHLLSESSKKYKCDECGQVFINSSNLSRHRLTHSGVKSHVCKLCGKGFHQKSNLISHIKIHDQVGEVETGGGSRKYQRRKQFICNICGEGFTPLSSLKAHTATVHANVTHLCETCGKGYKKKDHLKLHLKVHSGVKAFTCNVCTKAFIDNTSLKIHMRTHTGEKPFRCEECGKTFSQQAHMKSHVRIHTGEKPFKCSICEKAFRQLSTKIEHERTHKKCKKTHKPINRSSGAKQNKTSELSFTHIF